MRSRVGCECLAIGLLVALSVAPACGGETHNDLAASGGASQGDNSTGGQVGDAGDAGNLQDASVCDPQTCVASLCGIPRSCSISGKYIGSGADLIDCAIQLPASPTDAPSVFVFVDCVRLPQPTSYDNDAGTSWNIDYSTFPASLVFAPELCNQLQMNNSTPVYMLSLSCVVL